MASTCTIAVVTEGFSEVTFPETLGNDAVMALNQHLEHHPIKVGEAAVWVIATGPETAQMRPPIPATDEYIGQIGHLAAALWARLGCNVEIADVRNVPQCDRIVTAMPLGRTKIAPPAELNTPGAHEGDWYFDGGRIVT